MTAGMTRRILKRYDAATADQLAAGHSWYRVAQEAAHALTCPLVSFEQAAYVIAALSPQVSWDKNLDAAERLIAQHRAGTFDGKTLTNYPGYSLNVRKCAEILAGNLDALNGPKVTAFAHAIMGDLSMTVIDVWATRVARSSIVNTAKLFRHDEMPGARERRAIEQAYRNAARLRNVEPSVIQACTWLVVRVSGDYSKPPACDKQGRKWYARQNRARVALGLSVLVGDHAWQNTPRGQVAALAHV